MALADLGSETGEGSCVSFIAVGEQRAEQFQTWNFRFDI